MGFFCTRCGASLNDGDKFCPKCGEKVFSDFSETEKKYDGEDIPRNTAPTSGDRTTEQDAKFAGDAGNPAGSNRTGNSEIKERAKRNFKDNYWTLICAFLIYCGSISIVIVMPLAPFISYILGAIVGVGFCRMCVRVYRGEKPQVKDVFDGFNGFGRVLIASVLCWVYTLLWSLLLVIPGIIKYYAYFFTQYIVMDFPRLSASQAIELSKKMTKGCKWKIFMMQLSFIGWVLLSVITCGLVGIFYAFPYMSVALAGIYEEVKNQKLADGELTLDELGRFE